MNTPDSSTVNTTAKKVSFSSATRALVLGLALLLPVAAALAADPIPGIDIIVKKKPGGIIINASTEANGAYQFKGLAAGNYELSVGGKLVKTMRVGNDGGIKGVLSRQPDGKASITFNGLVGVVPGLIITFTAGTKDTVQAKNIPPVITAIAKAEEPVPDVLPSSRGGSTGLVKPFEDLAVKHEKTAPGSDGGNDKLPSLAGEPIPGVDVNLGKNPGGIVASSKTDGTGAFHFDKLPAGNYELKVPGQPDQLLTVGADGIAGGKLMKGPDGSLSIFDRWGKSVASSSKDEGIKAAPTPFSFGSGNLGIGPSMGGPINPGPSPVIGGGPMSPMSPMSPGGPGAGMRR